MKLGALKLNYINKQNLVSSASSKLLQAYQSPSSQPEIDQFNLRQFITNQNQLNTMFKSFLNSNLAPNTANKINHTYKNSEEYLTISNQSTKQRMKHGRQFKQFLDPRDQILEHDFDFTVKINLQDIRQKGFLKSQTYIDIIDKAQQFMVETLANILSVSFKFLHDKELQQKEVKNYAASNIMLNTKSVFSKTMEALQCAQALKPVGLNYRQIRLNFIERMESIIKNILVNQAAYYPQAPITGGTLRMNSAIHEVNRVDDEQNDLIYGNGIKISKHLKTAMKGDGQWNKFEDFQLRQGQDYTEFIMEVINSAIKVVQTCEGDSRQRVNKEIFTQFNKELFALSQIQSFKELLQIAENKSNGLKVNARPSQLRKLKKYRATKQETKINEQQSDAKLEIEPCLKNNSQVQAKSNAQEAKMAICYFFQRITQTKDIQQGIQPNQKHINKLCQQINKERQKGLEELKDYGIGFKIPNYVKPFSRQQMTEKQFRAKNSSVLRILTKWAEYLEDIFINSQRHIMMRLYPFKDIHNNLINITKQQVKREIVKRLNKEYEQVNRKLEKIKARNIELVSQIFSKRNGSLPYNVFRFTQTRQVSTKINAVLTSLMVQYLSVLIHHLLSAGKLIYDEKSGINLIGQNIRKFVGNINLVVFKVSDLMRAKFKCSQSSFISLLKTMHLLDDSKDMKGKFKLVRIKNKLEDSANNIMINYLFMGKVLCQLQLSIQQSKGKEKNYYIFSHFIYELTRGNFGAISECAIMISQLDPIVNSCDEIYYKEKYQKYKQQQGRIEYSKDKLYKIDQNIFDCSSCNRLIIKQNQSLFEKVAGQKKCIKCLLSGKEQIETQINMKVCPHKQLVLQFIREDKIRRITNYKEIGQSKVFLRIDTTGKMEFVITLYAREELKHFLVKVNSAVLKKIENSQNAIDFSEVDYIHIQKFINNKKQINDHLLYNIKNNQILNKLASSIGFDQRTFLQQVHKLSQRFLSFRIQKNLIKSIKFKAQIIHFNENSDKWACFYKLAQVYSHQSKENNQIQQLINQKLSYRKNKQLQLNKIKVIQAYNNTAYSSSQRIPTCHNLQEIKLTNNKKLVDLDFLDRHNSISMLDLSNNCIKNIDGLASLTNIHTLSLSRNQIQNVDSLSKITKINKLDLSNNNLQNIDGLANIIAIRQLYLASNQLQKVDALSNITTIDTLEVYSNQLQDVDGLSNLTAVNNMNIALNRLRNVDGLSKLATANQLIITGNQIQNLKGLSKITSINQLCVNKNQLQNVDDLKHITHISKLQLMDNKIKNVDGLSNIVTIDDLSLNTNQLENVDGLSKIKRITYLGLSNNQLKNVDGLSNFTSIAKLIVFKNKLQSIDRLQNVSIQQLWAHENSQLQIYHLPVSVQQLSANSKSLAQVDFKTLQKLTKMKTDITNRQFYKNLPQQVLMQRLF